MTPVKLEVKMSVTTTLYESVTVPDGLGMCVTNVQHTQHSESSSRTYDQGGTDTDADSTKLKRCSDTRI